MLWKVLLTGTAIAALALAQDTGSMGGGSGGGSGRGQSDMGGGGGMGGGGSTRMQKQTKADMMISRLKLNKDQQNEFVTILESAAKENAPVVQQMLQARNMLATALVKGKTGADLEPLQKALADTQFQMTGVEVRTFQRILGLLKPNQTAKAPEAFDIMAEIFVPQGGPGMGGGGMGRRGGGGGGGGR